MGLPQGSCMVFSPPEQDSICTIPLWGSSGKHLPTSCIHFLVLLVKQERTPTGRQLRDPELQAWQKRRKPSLRLCGAGLASQCKHRPLNSIPGYPKVPNFKEPLAIFSDSSYSLLADDVLGAFLLCPHPKKANYGSLVVRGPSGLVTRLVENTRKGKFLLEVTVQAADYYASCNHLNRSNQNSTPSGENVELFSISRSSIDWEVLKIFSSINWLHALFLYFHVFQKCKSEFGSISELIEHYTKVDGELPCTLCCARVNHCYEWEENANEQQHSAKQRVQTKSKTKLAHGKKWL